jgi:predicted chitinase
MLISPPFLPPRLPNETDEAWLDRAMPRDPHDVGRYPISFGTPDAADTPMMWHPGLHLVAPEVAGAYLPVCAMADGVVRYCRSPSRIDQDPNHPLNYGDHEGQGSWTSDGCVVIEHITEIGATPENVATRVTFYSVYMHLHALEAGLAAGKAVYRKDKLGQAGYVYGQPHRLHLEILCDDANVRAIAGRAPSVLSTASNPPDGRRDAVFGEIYYWCASELEAMSSNPTTYAGQLHDAQTLARKKGKAIPTALPDAPRLVERVSGLLVGIRFAGQGDVVLNTYSPSGTLLRARTDVGFEYNMYREAMSLADALDKTKSRPQDASPSGSAVYELLRFGRVLGTEALTPADAPHWRRIALPSGQDAWVNLNASGVRKFSDADMPGWKHWTFVEDFADGNSRVDVRMLRSWASEDGASTVTPQTSRVRMSHQSVRDRMSKLVCKVPYEWNKATLDARWAWLKHKGVDNPHAMTEHDYTRFKDHVARLCFWEAKIGVPEMPWSLDPQKFVEQFRRCGWLNAEEFAQCFPRKILHLSGSQFVAHSIKWKTAHGQALLWNRAFNRATRKYGVALSHSRLIHFLSHVIPETGSLTLVKEIQGERKKYSPFYGRGLIQLTHFENYRDYGRFRRFEKVNQSPEFEALGWNPDNLIARDNSGSHNAENCADSACFYVARREGMLRHMDAGLRQSDAIVVSKDVNGYVAIENLNGLEVRLQSVVFLLNVLMDDAAATADAVELNFRWRRNSSKEPVVDSAGAASTSGHPPKAKTKFYLTDHVIQASLQKQVP